MVFVVWWTLNIIYCVLLSFCSMEYGFLLAVLQWWQEISNSLPKHFIAVFHLIVRYTNVLVKLNHFFLGMSHCNRCVCCFWLAFWENALSNVSKLWQEKIVAQIIDLLLVAAVNHDKVCCRSELKGDLRQVSVAEWLLRHSFGSYGNLWLQIKAVGW